MSIIKNCRHSLFFLSLLCFSCHEAEEVIDENSQAGSEVMTYTMLLDADCVQFDEENPSRATSSIDDGRVPVYYDFSQSDVFYRFTVINANNDNKTWMLVEGMARYSYHSSNPANDWLITPLIRLEKGKTYRLQYECYAESSLYPESMEVYLGTSATIAGMNQCIVSEYTFSVSGSKDQEFSVLTTGDYYIGFHAISAADMYNINLRSISLNETSDSRTSHWQNGDKVYLSFSDNGNIKTGYATYSSSSKLWNVTVSSGSGLSPNTVNNCAIYYVKNGSPSLSSGQLSLNESMAIYLDQDASYTVTGNTITLSAALQPLSWRLCFKGASGEIIQVASTSGISYYSKLNLNNNQFTTAAKDYSLSVQSHSYTPYIHGIITTDDNTLTVVVDNITYTRNIRKDLLSPGRSGYFTIPTPESHSGWNSSADSVEPYVDLGLPSGIMWASCNLGAARPEGYGYYYAWGETTGYNSSTTRNFNWGPYKLCNGSNVTLECYCTDSRYGSYDNVTTLKLADDAAHVALGDKWRMPTDAEFTELTNNCNLTHETLNGVDGRRFTSRINGNSIFLPLGGCLENAEYKNAGAFGNYWTSSLHSDCRQAWARWFDKTGGVRRGGINRCYAETIRPVYDPDLTEDTSLDIDLEGYGSDQSLDETGGSGIEHTGKQDVNLEGYGNDQSLD